VLPKELRELIFSTQRWVGKRMLTCVYTLRPERSRLHQSWWPSFQKHLFLKDPIVKRALSSFFAAASVAALVACAAPGPQPGEVEVRRGVIEQIQPVQLASNHHQGVGAVVGGVLGLGVGSLIGSGSGRDVAMVLGTIGGAVAGNEVQKKHDQPVAGQQVIVRTSNGVLVSITQPVNASLRVGQSVYIEGNGESARVVPR
jgi:outer membrane lipoprotein SlyB